MILLTVCLDYGLAGVHGVFVLFNLTGWAFRRTRRLHLAVISLTLVSWVGLGAFFGWGYCPLTDWHWSVKEELGQTDLPASYIKYYADRLTGYSWDAGVIDMITGVSGMSAFFLSYRLNFRARSGRRSDHTIHRV